MAVDVGGRGSTQGLRPAKKPVRKPRPTVVHRQAPRKPQPSYRNYNPPRSRNRGSGGGGSSNRSSGGNNNKVRKPAPAPKPAPVKKPPKPPSIDAYLRGDSAYQSGLSGNKRSLTDYLSELNRRRGESGTQYNTTKASMNRDRAQQLEDLRNEFASRGLIQSGIYGEEQGDFQQKFTEQMSALDQQQTALIADLLAQEKNYKRNNDLANEQLRQEALLRRAQKYNIGA